jgi:hypothetical protein
VDSEKSSAAASRSYLPIVCFQDGFSTLRVPIAGIAAQFYIAKLYSRKQGGIATRKPDYDEISGYPGINMS